jgi:hypothetical protein
MMNSWLTYRLRTGMVCSAVACIVSSPAPACSPSVERAIIFENVPTDIDAPVIIEASLYDFSEVSDAAGKRMILMNARVDRVIKGSVDLKTLKIFVHDRGCTRASIGQGIVLGTLRDDPQFGLGIEALDGSNTRTWSRAFLQKQMDIWDAAPRTNNAR